MLSKGFFQGSQVALPAVFGGFIGSSSIGSSLNLYSFTLSFTGLPAGEKLIVVSCGGNNNNSGVANVTINGQTATIVNNSTSSGYHSACQAVLRTTATSITSVTFQHNSGTTQRGVIDLYYLLDVRNDTPEYTEIFEGFSGGPSFVNIDVPRNGTVLATAFMHEENESTWTGVTEVNDNRHWSTFSTTGGYEDVPGGETGRYIEAVTTGQRRTLFASSWR